MPSPAPLPKASGASASDHSLGQPVRVGLGAFLSTLLSLSRVFAVVFGVYSIGRSWLGPVKVESEISQNPRSLPLYALYSLVRILLAYVLSLHLCARLRLCRRKIQACGNDSDSAARYFAINPGAEFSSWRHARHGGARS